MKTKVTLLTLLLMLAMATWAQDEIQRLVVWQKSGAKVYFDLAEEPRTMFADGQLVITTNTMQTSYPLSDILRFTHEGVASGIVEADAHNLTVSQNNDEIILKNVPAGTPVRLYDSAGRLLETKNSDGTSQLQFSLTGRPSGVYLVNMNNQTFKISKR